MITSQIEVGADRSVAWVRVDEVFGVVQAVEAVVAVEAGVEQSPVLAQAVSAFAPNVAIKSHMLPGCAVLTKSALIAAQR